MTLLDSSRPSEESTVPAEGSPKTITGDRNQGESASGSQKAMVAILDEMEAMSVVTDGTFPC